LILKLVLSLRDWEFCVRVAFSINAFAFGSWHAAWAPIRVTVSRVCIS